MAKFAWVTLATNDSYSLGALVLAHSLRRVNTAHQLVVLITPGVTEAMKTQLSAVYNVVKLVDVLDSRDTDNLALLARPELGITFTKLHCWKLTEYEKCVFLDADTLVLQNSDELFEREELSAAPDAGWPDCFNSGVFVFKPSNETFKALIEFALIHGSFDGGDQGLLNLFFSDWATKDIQKHLPFVYNMCSTATYSYLPAFKQFGAGLKIIHFIGAAKPWLQPFNTETGLASVSGDSQHVVQFVQLWWDVFCGHVHPSLSSEMTWHRLRSSYEFFTTPAPTPIFHPEKSNYFEPRPSSPPPSFIESNYHKQKPYVYFDPWDEYIEQNDLQMSMESYINYNSSVDNYTISNSEINYSDHLSEITNNQFSNVDFIDNHRQSFEPSHSEHYHTERDNHSENLSDQRNYSNNHISHSQNQSDPSNHTLDRHNHVHSSREYPSPEPSVRKGESHPDVSIGGGGNLEMHSRPSRRDSFSQPERSQSAPEIRVNRPLVPSVHPHEPPAHPTIHEPPHCEPSSVDCHPSREQHSQSAQGDEDAGLAGALANVTLGAPLTVEQRALEEHLRRQGWEQGNIDYMGKDSFSNIWEKICETLSGGQQQTRPPEDAPAPVAPIAAPVYVSSVEISPAGPIDTSPSKANYAPVSALEPTVEASDTKNATKAPSSEAATVTPQPKSSVTEVVTTEASVTPSVTSDTSAPTPQVISEPPAIPLPASPVESIVKLESTPVVLSETPVPAPPVLAPPTSETTVPVPPVSSTDATTAESIPPPAVSSAAPLVSPPFLTETPVSTTQSPLAPIETPVLAPTPTETPVSAPTPKETPVSAPTPTETPAVPPPASTPSPTVTAPTSTESPTVAPPVPAPTPIEVTATPVSTPAATEPPVPASVPTKTGDSASPIATPVPTETAVSVPPVPAPSAPTPTVTPVSVPTPTETPAVPPPASTPSPTVTAPTSTESPTVAPPVPAPTPIEVTATPISTPAATPTVPPPASTPSPTVTVPTSTESPTVAPPVPAPSVPTPTAPPVSADSPVVVPSEAPVEVPKSTPEPTSASIVPVTSTPATPAEPLQPQTPVVTEPTPPTSPPVAAEAPQLTKLQVEAEVPGTPPAGGSTQPSLEEAAAQEPPVPPKRKGGAKAPQDVKNQKGGKPSKGKK